MSITIAFALSPEGIIKKDHFGDADQFAVFAADGQGFTAVSTLDNPFKDVHGHHHHSRDHGHGHGHGNKALALAGFLREQGVQAVVSRQFGPNVRRLCPHLVPILVTEESVEEAQRIIQVHLEAVATEWEAHREWHSLLKIKEDQVRVVSVKS